MKLLRIVPIAAVLYVLFFTGSTTMTSCTKETDTTYVRDTIVDTLIVRDTISVKDTTCRLYAGLVAYYNFNGGNLNDSSGYGNHIVFSNATVTTDRWGNPGNAYLFNGSNSYMQVKNSASLNPSMITLAAVVKVNGFYHGLCHANDIIVKGAPDNVNGIYCLRMKDQFVNCSDPVNENTEFFFGAYGNNITTSNATTAYADSVYVKTGQWYTVVYTYDGTYSRIYLNGELKKESKVTAAFTANTQDLFIGKNEDTQGLYPYLFNGVIDEIRIYNRPLNANEAKQLSNLVN